MTTDGEPDFILKPLTEEQKENIRRLPARDLEQKEMVFQAVLDEPNGLAILSQAMVEPIAISMQYRSHLRRVLDECKLSSMPEPDWLPEAFLEEGGRVGHRYLTWSENGAPVLQDRPHKIDIEFTCAVEIPREKGQTFTHIDQLQVAASRFISDREQELLDQILLAVPSTHIPRCDAETWDDITGLMAGSVGVISATTMNMNRYGMERDTRPISTVTGQIGSIGAVEVYDMGLSGSVIFPPKKYLGRLYHHASPCVLLTRTDNTIIAKVTEQLVIAIEKTASTLTIH